MNFQDFGTKQHEESASMAYVQPKIGRAKPSEIFTSHPKLNIGSGIYNFNELKKQFSHLSKLPNDVLALEDVKMVIGQDLYHLIRPLEYRSGHVKAGPLELNLDGQSVDLCRNHPGIKVSSNLSVAQDSLTEQVKIWWDIESYAESQNHGTVERQSSRSDSAEQPQVRWNEI